VLALWSDTALEGQTQPFSCAAHEEVGNPKGGKLSQNACYHMLPTGKHLKAWAFVE
jgi:hypothetical protein